MSDKLPGGLKPGDRVELTPNGVEIWRPQYQGPTPKSPLVYCYTHEEAIREGELLEVKLEPQTINYMGLGDILILITPAAQEKFDPEVILSLSWDRKAKTPRGAGKTQDYSGIKYWVHWGVEILHPSAQQKPRRTLTILLEGET